MLVLTRRLQEKIQIGSDITITIVRIKGNQVKLGIEAPTDIAVKRVELPDAAEPATMTLPILPASIPRATGSPPRHCR